jgi:uncharacterized membrane protein YdfJ with MMPL/SSD domain
LATALYKLGRFIVAHRLVVLLAWVIAVAGVILVVFVVGSDTSNDQSLPGTDSQRATDLLAEQFPPQQNGRSPIVFSTATGKLDDGGTNQKAINAAATAIRKVPHVVSAVNPFSQDGAAQLSKSGRIAFISVLMDVGSGDITAEEAQAVLDAAEPPARKAGLTVAAGGPVGSELSKPHTESSEVVGLLVAMVILTLAFGSAVAMGMPIVTAVLALAGALGAIGLLGHVLDIPVIAPTLATMIGLGVGIDYALFLVTRHLDQVRAGMDVGESVALAVATSGSAIVFAGSTVVIALLALSVAGIPLVSALGYASSVAVLTAVLGAVTLLPALLALVGHRILSLRVPAFLRPRARTAGTGMWAGWGRAVTRHPLAAIGVAVPLLLLLAVPLLSLNLGQEDIGATPTDTTERQAYDLMTQGFGVGYNGPLLVAVRLPSPATANPTVTAQENQLKALQAELEQEQKEGQQQQAQLEAQAAELEAQQASLEKQEADLKAQQAALEREAAGLQRQRSVVEAERARLEREIAAITGRASDLLARAKAAIAKADANAAQRQAAERQLAAVLARVRQVEAEIAAAEADARPPLQALLTRLEAEAQRLRDVIAGLRAEERAQAAQAAALRRQARSLPGVPGTLRRQAEQLAANAAALARDAAALDAQKRTLEAQAATLRRQAAALTAQAADLQAQQAQLLALQSTADEQKQQALALKNQLTKELTKAGGDDRGTDPRLVKIQDALTGTAGIVRASPPQINKGGGAVVFTAVPSTAPAATQTADLVKLLRNPVLPEATAGDDVDAYVGGSTAGNVDLAAKISSRLPLVILVVLGLSFVVLLLAFRSLLVPLQAAFVNLLCVGASFGVLTAAFQWGWGIGIFGIDTASDTVPIASFVPLMMFAVLFGLSMDYQVFLLSQVATHRAEGEGDRDAVASGVASSARVISAAALIMIGVFGSFVLDGDPTVKQFGVGLAVAVALAASMVIVLTPALLALMGRRTWALPAVVGRALPRIDIEGEGVLEEHGTLTPAPAAGGATDRATGSSGPAPPDG